jgi:signal transduction histidine kinase
MRGAVEQLAREIESLRAIISDLRPAALDQLGLAPALEALAERTGNREAFAVGLTVDVPVLDDEVETTIYRLVQEALTNVKKHASASTARVEVTLHGGHVDVTVTDDGGGFDPEASTAGFGLAGMRERAALAGGSLQIASGPKGTTIRASVPATVDYRSAMPSSSA